MIKGLKVQLRGLQLEDVTEIMKHWNRLELRNYLVLLTPQSTSDEEQFIKSTWNGFKTLTRFAFGIEVISDALLIGIVELASVEWLNRSAELGIVIFNDAYQGKGYGTEAVQLMLFYGFNILNLHSVRLRVYDYNQRAIKSYLKVGFKEVGRLRDARLIHGQYHDVILMDILESELRLPKSLSLYLKQHYQNPVNRGETSNESSK